MSFSYDGLARTQFTVIIQEPNTGLSISIPIPDISILRPPLALRPAVTLKQAPLPDAAKYDPVQAALFGLGRDRGDADADHRPGQPRRPPLRPHPAARQLVSVRGAGPSL